METYKTRKSGLAIQSRGAKKEIKKKFQILYWPFPGPCEGFWY